MPEAASDFSVTRSPRRHQTAIKFYAHAPAIVYVRRCQPSSIFRSPQHNAVIAKMPHAEFLPFSPQQTFPLEKFSIAGDAIA